MKGLRLLSLNQPELLNVAAFNASLAFADDPSLTYSLPDPAKRANLHHAFEYYLKLTLLNGGEVFVTSEKCEGVALWEKSGTRNNLFADFRAGLLRLPLYCGWQFLRYSRKEDAFCQKLKRKYAPEKYMYLGLLAVAPSYQGKGFARQLLKPMLDKLDGQNLACYLETQNSKNVALYQGYGFELKESTLFPPGSACEVHIMLRPPGG